MMTSGQLEQVLLNSLLKFGSIHVPCDDNKPFNPSSWKEIIERDAIITHTCLQEKCYLNVGFLPNIMIWH